MSWSSNSPLAVVRGGMWGFLLFAGAAWLTIAWSVLRLEPMGIARVAGAVILFGAVTEALRALAGTRVWWLNAAMAVLFAVTGVLLLADRDSSFTTGSALIGWYLMVRGAVDVAVATVNRVADRGWGLTMVLGVLQVGLGFFAASRYSRTAEVVVLVLGALALMRGVADLVASLILRETAVTSDRPREKAAGLAGYAAGLADFAAAATVRSGRARHRATGLLGGRAGSAAAAAAATDAPTDDAGRAMANGAIADHPMADRPMADRAMADRAIADRAIADRAIADRATAGGATAGGAAADRAIAERDAVLALAGVSGAITAAQPAVGVSTARDGMVAATMFTGPHHVDGRDGGAATAPAAGAPVAAPPEAGTSGAGTSDATPRRSGRRGATRATRTARDTRDARDKGDAREARDASATGTVTDRGDERGRGDGAKAERGGLAVRTARLFGRAGRDNR